MKRTIKSLFISLFATTFIAAFLVGLNMNSPKQYAAKAEEAYTLIEQNNGLDFSTSANNATTSLATHSYAVQSGDYLALDIEGYVAGDMVFKVGLNGNLIADGADFAAIPSSSRTNGWGGQLLYGRWLFATSGRGIVYYSLSEFFPSVSTINTLNFLFSDNKLEAFTLHNAFITNSTTARDGTALLDVFDGLGNLDNNKVTSVDVSVIARKTAKGFQTNKSLDGAVTINMPKTHIEITLDDTVNAAGGGYLAYDIAKSRAGFAYFQVSVFNTSSIRINADYYENGKSLSKNGVLNYSDLTTLYGWYYTEVAASGTVLERIQTATGILHKIVIDCDNMLDGQIALSNFYFISSDFATIVPLVDLANMSASDRENKISISCTAEGFATAFNRCAFYCDNSGVNKPTFNNIVGETYWSWDLLADQFDALLSNDEKNLLIDGEASESGNEIAKALARYDFIVGKYYFGGLDVSFTDFMGRNPAPIANLYLNAVSQNTSSNPIVLIIAVSSSLAAVGTFLLMLRKKKEDK